jgi:transcription initiation factor TFIIIB Brf1 subunit/transcription initiation factor TFIIB
MPAGRSTFNKRQKEQQRQQKARDKAERRLQRKTDEPENEVDEMAEMRRLAEEQAALFRIGDEAGSV